MIDAALLGERLAVALRKVASGHILIKPEIILLRSAEALGIRLSLEGGVFRAVLPFQLPKRKWKNTEFLTRPLMATMREFSQTQSLPRYDRAAVCFVHVVAQEKPLSLVRDHDNIECKQILDVLGTFLLRDDNGLLCSVHQRTERGEADQTEVYLMPAEDFPDWLGKREKERE